MMFNIISLIGPSGSGKTTIQKYLGFEPIITYTSRKPRNGEVDGIHYYFTSREKILEMQNHGELLEHTEYNGNLYATDLKSIKEQIENNKIGSIVVDGNGARELKKHFAKQVLTIGIVASKEECMQRISNRNDSNTEKRLASYEEEVKDIMEISNILIMNSAVNWSKNQKILNWVREGLIQDIV